MRGTVIGRQPTDQEFIDYAQRVTGATAGLQPDPRLVGVPGQFWPVTGLTAPTFDQSVAIGLDMLAAEVDARTGPVVVFGHSQSAVIASREKARLSGDPALAPGEVTFVLTANPNRPNGGLLARFAGLYLPILDVSFNGATPVGPADGALQTFDVARQYDGWADFPRYPLNLVATLNAVLGIYYLHGGYYDDITPEVLTDPARTQVTEYGDTTYYLVLTPNLPLLQPLRDLGVPEALVAAIEPGLRRLVELGYDRDTPAGVHAPARLRPPLPPAAPQSSADAGARQAVEPEPVEPEPVGEPAGADEPVLRSRVRTGIVRESLRATVGAARRSPGAATAGPGAGPREPDPADSGPTDATGSDPDRAAGTESQAPAGEPATD